MRLSWWRRLWRSNHHRILGYVRVVVGVCDDVITTKSINVFGAYHKPQWKAQVRLFKLGFPVAAALFFEVTLFAVVALLVSPLGPIIVAAHQVAINFSSLVFMLPMSVGAAVSIRVGHRLGEEMSTVHALHLASVLWLVLL